MSLSKKILLAIIAPLFTLLLFATALDIGFVRTFGRPAVVKRVVNNSGIYNSAVPSVLSQTKEISTSYGTISTTDPDIKKAVNVALPPQYIKQNTELAIDNTYDWLDGKIAQPDFSIDLSGAKTLFANNIADALQKKLNALPACTTAQSLAIAKSGTFDVYNATCLPRGTNPAAIAEQARASLMSQQDFLKDTSISASNVTAGGQSIFSQPVVKQIPSEYQLAEKAPAFLVILTVLSGTSIIFVSRTRLAGLRRIGVSLLMVGIIMLIGAWVITHTVNDAILPKIKVDNAIFQEDIRALVSGLAGLIEDNYRLFGVIYTAAGAGAIVSAEIVRRRLSSAKIAAEPPKSGGSLPVESAGQN